MLREKVVLEVFLLAGLLSGVVCDDSYGLRLTTESSKTQESTQYRFHYFVKDETTGDYKAQEETRRGDSVQGSYTIADPNGDLRTVTYKAGPGTGFEATVNVHPSGSPMKQPSEATTVGSADIKTETTLESKVKRFPGGFAMNITSPQSDMRTEIGMNFSLKADSVTEPVTETTSTFTTLESNTTETTEVVETTNTAANIESPKTEISTISTEGRDLSDDLIEKEIDEAVNSLPKLPELVLSDNKTHFKFHKDPEEALLDERITQIARQLAETSLRKEYEERKLGHFIPIIVPSTTDYLSKSFKLTPVNSPSLRPSEPLHVLTHMKMIPEYIYKQTIIPRISPFNYRLPVVSRPSQQTEAQALETITEDILKVDKSKTKNFNKVFKIKESYNQATSMMPLQVPTFFQFFSPYLMQTSGYYTTQEKSQPTTEKMENETDVNDNTTESHVTTASNRTS